MGRGCSCEVVHAMALEFYLHGVLHGGLQSATRECFKMRATASPSFHKPVRQSPVAVDINRLHKAVHGGIF